MIPIDTLILFTSAAFALALVPGPDNIFVLTQSALHGRLAGLIVTLGLASGLLFHTTAVALGVAAIFETSQLAFTILKYVGAAYLLYLAWGAIKAGQSDISGTDTPVQPLRKLYLRGLIMNVTNPKVTIFFLAFLPQFVDPDLGPIIPQFFQLGILMIITTIITFGAIGLGAGFLGNWLRTTPKAQIWINRASAFVFIALAAKLATAQN